MLRRVGDSVVEVEEEEDGGGGEGDGKKGRSEK